MVKKGSMEQNITYTIKHLGLSVFWVGSFQDMISLTFGKSLNPHVQGNCLKDKNMQDDWFEGHYPKARDEDLQNAVFIEVICIHVMTNFCAEVFID